MFNFELFNPEKIANELYNPKNIGVLSIPNFLWLSTKNSLLEELSSVEYKKADYQRGKAFQDFYFFNPKEEMRMLPLISLLKISYASLYNSLAEKSNFQSALSRDILIQKYKKDSRGISPHIDDLKYKNLISILVIEGNGEFYVCKNREKEHSTRIENPPGSLILMRAPRSPKEKELRQMHYLENISSERTIITFREI